MRYKVGYIRKLIKEFAEEQDVKEEKFDDMLHRINDAVDTFISFLIKHDTSPDEYKEYMEKLNKVLTGLKQLNMSKVKFLGKNKSEREKDKEKFKLGQNLSREQQPPSLKGGTGH